MHQTKYEKLVADAFKMYGDMQGTKLSQLWEAAVQEVCVQPRDTGVDGATYIPRQTVETFEQCLEQHKLKVLRREAAFKQCTYMQRSLKKARSMSVRDIAGRLGEMNSYLKHYPAYPLFERHMDEPFNKPMKEVYLGLILLDMIPSSWRVSFQAIHPNYCPTVLQELVVKLEGIERQKKAEERVAELSTSSGTRSNNPPKSGRAGSGKGHRSVQDHKKKTKPEKEKKNTARTATKRKIQLRHVLRYEQLCS